jgi:C1A family cysteine protease
MQYVTKFNKNYKTSEEFEARFQNFLATHKFIQENNASGETHVAGHNKFSDWSREEYQSMLGLKNIGKPLLSGMTVEAGNLTYPTSVNWVTAGKVNPVKDQGQCGSCWAFSTSAANESANAIFKGSLISLSEQQLVDCSFEYGNLGCNGGWYYDAWNYLQKNGQELESAYPYKAVRGTCAYSSTKGVFNTAGTAKDSGDYVQVAANTAAIKTAIARQPVSVAIQADTYTFQSYSSGVITGTKCGDSIDHAVTAVGYGTDAVAGDYYLVRNSWGTTWGDKGYVKIGAAEGNGVCGINEYVAYPIVK